MTRSVCAMLLSGAVAIFVSGDAGAAENTLSDSEEKAGWKLLFDGESTDGWRNYKKDTIGDGWVVEDGALVRAEKGAGDIISKDKYGSFELSLDYKISEGGNSGIMFHVTEDNPKPWQSGPEIQILDNASAKEGQKAGWLYQLYSPGKDRVSGETLDATRPAGEWNHVQLRVTPAQSEINLNGYRYATFRKGSKQWDKKVAESKFSKYDGFGKATKGHIALQDHGNRVAFRNIKIRELPDDGKAPEPIDGELPVAVEQAFPNMKWADWSPVSEEGELQEFRPIVLTHANDGSGRTFLATQQGVIYVFDKDASASSSKVFADLRDKVVYNPKQNEEGFLGLAFHPDYKDNGEFFAYYTTTDKPHTSVISRFKVSKENPDKADPEFEEELLRIPQPFWNHNGGTIAFGPDGYLYIGLGDGGAANDPHGNAQNLGTLLGSILRIDVDNKDSGKNYAIPKDNPFVNKEGAKPEIYAYGVRNIWRLAFDRETGTLWAGDVGQNLWEEIDIVKKGGNYGWNLRESMHGFGPNGSDSRKNLIDPIWEYDHQVGKSITGGTVYRGSKVPELKGKYLYADYVSGTIYALTYDEKTGKVIANELIPSQKMPILSFGEDEDGEVYFLMATANGKGVYRFKSASN
ncbi:Quinoprotein glucose dehydrogenase B precursor [Planctomycetes bacterium Pan216]|uniref:Quinoprotein glucose dehydrogenase B n=2 Tax=Kolteria novifilia TaxID=2527975 RepID=A0A518B372_9BACT|nr:Quinoprotein glucose dehydrogenase B precursor [Planctomycetes bacterium Pan216]